MTEFPNDLLPLPTAPYSERPISEPLVVEECRTSLWLVRGNITEAAKLLKVTSLRLRQFVNKSPYLLSEMQEAKDQIVDVAETVVYEALTDEDDKGRKDTMSRYVLSNLGRHRGWGTTQTGINIKNTQGGTIVVQWADGSTFGEAPQEELEMIDVTPNKVA